MTLQDNASNSLKKYRGSLLTSGQPANNFNRPNLNPNNGGKLEDIQCSNIFGSAPKVQWNSYNTTDPIFNWKPTSSSVSGVSGIEKFNTVLSAFTAIGGLVVTGATVAKSLGSLKSNDNSAENVSDSTLASLAEKADSYDKNSDYNSMLNTSNCLKKQISTTRQKLDNARNIYTTAEKTLTNLSADKTKFEGERNTFIVDRDRLKSDLSALELIPVDERTPEQVAKIAEIKKKLDEQYSDTKLKVIDDKIKNVDKQIAEWTNTKLENEILMANLPKEISRADKSYENLNKKINKKVQA